MKKLIGIMVYVVSMHALDMPPTYEQVEAEKNCQTFIEFCTRYKANKSQLLSYSEVVSYIDRVQKYSSQDPELKDALFELRVENVIRCFKTFKDPKFQKYLRKYPKVFSEMFAHKNLWVEIQELVLEKNDQRIHEIKLEIEQKNFLNIKVD